MSGGIFRDHKVTISYLEKRKARVPSKRKTWDEDSNKSGYERHVTRDSQRCYSIQSTAVLEHAGNVLTLLVCQCIWLYRKIYRSIADVFESL